MLGRIMGGSGPIDPSTLVLGLWQRDFAAASPWNGTASAGGSGSQHLQTLGTIPSAGATLNGHGTASFNGSTQALSSGTGTFSTFVDPGAVGHINAYSGWVILKPSVVTATYMIFQDVGGNPGTTSCMFAVQISASNAQVISANNKTASRAISASAWSMITYRWDGANLQIGVNENPGAAGGASIIADTTTITDTATILRCGENNAGANFYNGLIEEIAISGTAFSDAIFTKVRANLSARYASSF